MIINSEYLKSIGIEVKVARIRKGFSIMQLVKQTGLSKDALHQLEQGKHDFKILTLKRVADALEVQVNDFFVTSQRENKKKSPKETASIFDAIIKASVSGNPKPKPKKKKKAAKKKE